MLNCSEVKKIEKKPESTTFTFSQVPEGYSFLRFLETAYYNPNFMDFIKKLDTVEIQKFPFDLHTAKFLMNHFADLKTLRLNGQQEIEDAAISLVSTKLQALRITQSNITPSVFAGIKPENSPITRISVESCPNITGDVFELVLSKFPELVEIEVCGTGIEDKQIILNQKWPHIKQLILRASSKLGAEGLHTLLGAFPELEQLSLSMCPVKDGICVTASFLRSRMASKS